jgi:hypothetical protein
MSGTSKLGCDTRPVFAVPGAVDPPKGSTPAVGAKAARAVPLEANPPAAGVAGVGAEPKTFGGAGVAAAPKMLGGAGAGVAPANPKPKPLGAGVPDTPRVGAFVDVDPNGVLDGCVGNPKVYCVVAFDGCEVAPKLLGKAPDEAAGCGVPPILKALGAGVPWVFDGPNPGTPGAGPPPNISPLVVVFKINR